MRTVSAFIILTTLVFSCSEAKENTGSITSDQAEPIEVATEGSSPSADYSSLFTEHACDITVEEMAKALDVPVTDVSLPKRARVTGCSFLISGFGKNGLGEETLVEWFVEKVSKDEVRKEIQSYKEYQRDGLNKMTIEKSGTGDTYLARSPKYGRIGILNEDHENWVMISYSPKGIYKSRTEEQHATLGDKAVGLANYLLEKHKK